MVEVGRSSSPVDDHLLLFSSLPDTTQMNNAVPTSPLLQQMGHPHSYPSLGQISNPYEQQPPGKELNKYASLKAVGILQNSFASFGSILESLVQSYLFFTASLHRRGYTARGWTIQGACWSRPVTLCCCSGQGRGHSESGYEESLGLKGA